MSLQGNLSKLRILGYKFNLETSCGMDTLIITDIPERIKSLVIPEGVQSIKLPVHSRIHREKISRSIQTVKLPNTLKTIGDLFFFCCEGLVSVDIPSSVEWIGSEVFSGCVNLTHIGGIEHLKNIGYAAFENTKLEGDIKLNNKLKCLGERAFSGSKISSIDFNHCVINAIGNNTFSRCRNLERVLGLGNKTKAIGKFAFMDCARLKELEIAQEESEMSISKSAFIGCNNVKITRKG